MSGTDQQTRLFLGLMVEPEVGGRLARKSAAALDGEPGIRLYSPEDLHLTLVFLGQVETASLLAIREGITHLHTQPEVTELAHDVDNPRVAKIRHVLLEGEPEHGHDAVLHGVAAPDEVLDHLRCDECTHAVIDAPACKDDLRVVVERRRLMGEIVRIDANTMTTDQPRAKRQKIPFTASGF